MTGGAGVGVRCRADWGQTPVWARMLHHAPALPPSQVTMLGGSITAGALWPKRDMGYASRFFFWVNTTWPNA